MTWKEGDDDECVVVVEATREIRLSQFQNMCVLLSFMWSCHLGRDDIDCYNNYH